MDRGQVRVDMGQWDSYQIWAVSSLLCSSLTHQNHPLIFSEKLNPCPWAHCWRLGVAREHGQPQTFSESASSSRVELGGAGARQREPTQLEKLI